MQDDIRRWAEDIDLAIPSGNYTYIAMDLIERDANVQIPVRLLIGLISYALAGPSNDASTAARDSAVNGARRAISAAACCRPADNYHSQPHKGF